MPQSVAGAAIEPACGIDAARRELPCIYIGTKESTLGKHVDSVDRIMQEGGMKETTKAGSRKEYQRVWMAKKRAALRASRGME